MISHPLQAAKDASDSLDGILTRFMDDHGLTYNEMLLRISFIKTNLMKEVNNPGTVAGSPALYLYKELKDIVDGTAAVFELTRLEMVLALTDFEFATLRASCLLDCKRGQVTLPGVADPFDKKSS